MRCVKCDATVPFDSLFCNKCGLPLRGLIRTLKEESVWVGRISAKHLAPWYLLWTIFAAGLTYGFFRLVENRGGFRLWTYLALLAAPLVYFSLRVVRLKLTTHYQLTTHKVVIRTGFLTKTVKELPYEHIDDAVARQGFLARLFNVGTVTLFSSSLGRVELIGVDRPVELRDKIHSLMAAHKAGSER